MKERCGDREWGACMLSDEIIVCHQTKREEEKKRRVYGVGGVVIGEDEGLEWEVLSWVHQTP